MSRPFPEEKMQMRDEHMGDGMVVLTGETLSVWHKFHCIGRTT